jgi:hypothetical protein
MVYRPQLSKWWRGTCKLVACRKSKQQLTILWPKDATQQQSKRDTAKSAVQKNLSVKGLNEIVLLTHDDAHYLVIDGNHRTSLTFLNDDGQTIAKTPRQYPSSSVFVGRVSKDVFDRWHKWHDTTKGPVTVTL